MTLRTRLTLWYASLIILVVIGLGASVFLLMTWSLVRYIDGRLMETAEWIGRESPFVELAVKWREDYGISLSEPNSFTESVTGIQIWFRYGEEYRLARASQNIAWHPDPLDPKAIGDPNPHVFGTVTLNGSLWRTHTNPIVDNNGAVIGSIQVAQSLGTINTASNHLLLALVGCSVFAIAGAVVISRWSAKRMLQPIEDLTGAASRIAGTNDLATRLSWQGPHDELGRLISVFNRMMERLQHVFTLQQSFIHDVSHELRTPLTGAIGHLDLMRRYGADQESLDAMHSDMTRMSRLVNDLIMLARADYGGVTVSPSLIDADSVVLDAMQAMKPVAEAKRIRLKLEHLEPLRLFADAQHVRQLLVHVIGNGIKFTPEGGTVTVTVQRVDQMARIEVTDTGIGIAQEHLPRIFDRFYQVDTSRAQDGTAGFGLGLSLARWIAEAHGGSIDVRSQVGVGSSFSVHLPIARPEHEQLIASTRATRRHMPVRVPTPPTQPAPEPQTQPEHHRDTTH
ncbi:MAG: ATP-binding protein [Anaerolineae bacterium]|nr:ATP-binding protein [Anaerolineae bacterium]